MDDQQQAAQIIRQTITLLKQFLARDTPPKLSETDTKTVFIEKYISALGYEELEDIVREYYVKNSQEFIDYVLRIKGAPVLAVEAKPLQTDLTDKHAAQLVQYCSVEGIEWCALTNARTLWLFNTYLRGDQNQKLVVKLDLLGFNTDGEFHSLFEQIWLLSKKSLSSPTAINSWMEQRRLDQALRAILLNQHSNAVKVLVTDLAKSASLDVAPDVVVQWMRGQLTPGLAVVPMPPKVLPIRLEGRPVVAKVARDGPRYWLVPCGASDDKALPLQHLHRWLDKGMWGFYKNTPGRTHLRSGDYVCFYVNKVGVTATARIAGLCDALVSTEEWPEPTPSTKEVYKVPLLDVTWLKNALPISKAARGLLMRLDAFQGHDLTSRSSPGWFVQTTRLLTQHDFDVLVSGTAA